jgi:hypothetical protein
VQGQHFGNLLAGCPAKKSRGIITFHTSPFEMKTFESTVFKFAVSGLCHPFHFYPTNARPSWGTRNPASSLLETPFTRAPLVSLLSASLLHCLSMERGRTPHRNGTLACSYPIPLVLFALLAYNSCRGSRASCSTCGTLPQGLQVPLHATISEGKHTQNPCERTTASLSTMCKPPLGYNSTKRRVTKRRVTKYRKGCFALVFSRELHHTRNTTLAATTTPLQSAICTLFNNTTVVSVEPAGLDEWGRWMK